MKPIFVNPTNSIEKQPFEVVERKGVGHPDSIADGVAEAISIEYSRYCLKHFGAVLHHHLDKTLVKGGRAIIDYGVGKMDQPIKLIINGRISTQFNKSKIDSRKIQETAARQYLQKIFPNLEVNKWVEIESRTTNYSRNPVWYAPRNLDDLPEHKKVYASDTSAIVGWWPLSVTENLTLKIERYFYQDNNIPKFDYLGQDIKILAVRQNKNLHLTLCVPFIATKTLNHKFYSKKLKELHSELIKYGNQHLSNDYKLTIDINTQDKNLFQGSKRGTGHYFVASGSALDYGEEGVVGRGNRSRGIIAVMRPSSTDAIHGKNPAFHVGKVYAYFAEQIAQKISEQFNCECMLTLVTQNKRPLIDPQKVFVYTDKRCNKNLIDKIIKTELSKRDWIDKIVFDKYFLPLPGGTYGYQA